MGEGYGQTGPYREAAGYDVIIEAEAGLMHMLACCFYTLRSSVLINCHSTGEADRAPSKVGVAVTDLMTGLYAHGAIMAGLRSVNQTGQGVWIDCNLFETQVGTLFMYSCSPRSGRSVSGACQHCFQLPHRWARGFSARNCAPFHSAISGFPLQGRLPNDRCGQRQTSNLVHSFYSMPTGSLK